MKQILFLMLTITTSLQVWGQNEKELPKEYLELIAKAEALYENKEFKKSAETFSAAFKSRGWKGVVIDRYNAACSWALAGVPDSAFADLNRIAFRAQFSNVKRLAEDPDLTSLRKDKRWKPLADRVQENKNKKELKKASTH